MEIIHTIVERDFVPVVVLDEQQNSDNLLGEIDIDHLMEKNLFIDKNSFLKL